MWTCDLDYVAYQHKNMHVACWQKQVASEQNYVACLYNSSWMYIVHSDDILHRTGLFWLQFIVITTVWIYIKIIDNIEYIYMQVYIFRVIQKYFQRQVKIKISFRLARDTTTKKTTRFCSGRKHFNYSSII